jgi:D-alanine-D-alanine ligase
MTDKKKVALLVGGWSAERDVSLMKGKSIAVALKEEGYNVDVIDVTRDLRALCTALQASDPDVVFNNLYGQGGEDGQIQAVLEILGLPYTHSGVAASAIGMDKEQTKKIAASVGVPSAEGLVVRKEEVVARHLIEPPYVVKPVDEGSSVGISIIEEGENKPPLDLNDWPFGDRVMVEKYIPGREIHVAVWDGKAFDVTEVIFPGRFFDYDAKYSDQRTQLITPADVPVEIAALAKDYAVKTFEALGCRGLARCDFRYDDSKAPENAVYLLEINTMPGLAPGSVAVLQPEVHGFSFNKLCAHLIETATCAHPQKRNAP